MWVKWELPYPVQACGDTVGVCSYLVASRIPLRQPRAARWAADPELTHMLALKCCQWPFLCGSEYKHPASSALCKLTRSVIMQPWPTVVAWVSVLQQQLACKENQRCKSKWLLVCRNKFSLLPVFVTCTLLWKCFSLSGELKYVIKYSDTELGHGNVPVLIKLCGLFLFFEPKNILCKK